MNRKVLMTAFVLIAVLLATLMVGTASASVGQTKKEYVDYRFEAVLTNPITTVTIAPPMMIVEGVRPPSGIQRCVLTINDQVYTYPKDFNYSENFRLVANQVTGAGTIEVKTVFTFNLPGKPTLTDWLSVNFTRVGNRTLAEGTFYLTGTKMFSQVEGCGIEPENYTTPGVDYALHVGQMKGWPVLLMKAWSFWQMYDWPC